MYFIVFGSVGKVSATIVTVYPLSWIRIAVDNPTTPTRDYDQQLRLRALITIPAPRTVIFLSDIELIVVDGDEVYLIYLLI